MKTIKNGCFMIAGLLAFAFTGSAYAGGSYGTVYAYTTVDYWGVPQVDVNSVTVASPLVQLYKGGVKVGETTASICGYYSLNFNNGYGTYLLRVVESWYDYRDKDVCSTIEGNEYLGNTGDERVVYYYSNSWYNADIATF